MSDNNNVIFPRPLQPGDKIAIVSPAGHINAEFVEKAAEELRKQGWNPYISKHALGKSGSFSGTHLERYSDLYEAFTDPEVRAIICSRGGYGVVHILDRLDKLPLADDPKWIVGFSDISALHALMASRNIASVHSSMAKAIALGDNDENNAVLYDILQGGKPVHTFPSSSFDQPGIASGKLLGGNLAVLADLINTPYDVFKPGTILFIEDVDEPIYKMERILYQLKLAGILPKLGGLIVGQFTGYKPDANFSSMEEMISKLTSSYSYPVAMNVPFGHVDYNIPLISGAKATLRVGTNGTNSLVFW